MLDASRENRETVTRIIDRCNLLIVSKVVEPSYLFDSESLNVVLHPRRPWILFTSRFRAFARSFAFRRLHVPSDQIKMLCIQRMPICRPCRRCSRARRAATRRRESVPVGILDRSAAPPLSEQKSLPEKGGREDERVRERDRRVCNRVFAGWRQHRRERRLLEVVDGPLSPSADDLSEPKDQARWATHARS